MDVRIFWKTPEAREKILMAMTPADNIQMLEEQLEHNEPVHLSLGCLVSPPKGLCEMNAFAEGPRWVFQAVTGHACASIRVFAKTAIDEAQDMASIYESVRDIADRGIANLEKYGYAFAEDWYKEHWGVCSDVVSYSINDTHVVFAVGGRDLTPWIELLREQVGDDFTIEGHKI